jgi:hypothetical protein
MSSKQSRIKLPNLQRGKDIGGLTIKSTFICHVCRIQQCIPPILNMFETWIFCSLAEYRETWHITLEEVAFTDISLKQWKWLFGPIIAHTITIWYNFEKQCNWESIMPCDLEGGLLHPPNVQNVESVSFLISWTVMFREHFKIWKTHTLPGNSFCLNYINNNLCQLCWPMESLGKPNCQTTQ